jgi:hypothetical protein
MVHPQTSTLRRPSALIFRASPWRGMLTGQRLDCRQLEFLTFGPLACYFSAFLKMLTAVSASDALSNAR